MKPRFLNYSISLLLIILIISGVLPWVASAADGDSDSNGNSTGNELSDLTIEKISFEPQNPEPGQMATATITVKNQGPGISGETSLAYYVNDVRVGEKPVQTLAPGLSQQFTLSLKAENEETVSIRAVVDEGNSVDETNEKNNENRASLTFGLAGAPDLIIDTFNYPEISITENHEQIDINVKNQGTTASPATKLNLYIGDAYVREWDVPQLSAGESTEVQSETWIPRSGGQVNIKAIVDENNLVKETNENNNQKTSTISVTEKEDLEDQYPDLIIEDIVPETAQAVEGQMLNVTLKVKNQGMVPSGNALVRYYINGAQAQNELPVPALLAGETADVRFSLTPEKEGEMEIRSFVDSGTSVYEGDETNNELAETIIVKALLPDLTIEALSSNPETPELEKNITFTATVRNNGPGDAAATDVNYNINGNNDSSSGKISVPALTAGQTTTGTFSWTPKTEGKKEIKLSIDSGALVTETNENNNQLTKTITVAKKIVPGGNEQNGTSNNGSNSGSNSGSGSKSSSKSKSKSSMGSGVSQEPAKNIDVKELSTRYVISGYRMKYDFPEEVTCITYIEYDAKRTFKKTTTTVEVLKDKSNLVKALPSGTVYKHVNIWVGDKGAGLHEALDNGVVGFKVEKAWIDKNNNNNNNNNNNTNPSSKNNENGENKSSINEPDIILQWYDKEWKPLETKKTGEDKKYIFFEAKTPGYSSFAITNTQQSNKEENKTQLGAETQEALLNPAGDNEKETTNGSAQKEDTGIKKPMGLAKILMAISLPAFLILVEYFILKKKI